MSHPNTTREALLAEAIGDLGKLLDRLERCQVIVEGADKSFVRAALSLGHQTNVFQKQLHDLKLAAERDARQRIEALATQKADEIAAAQAEAMRTAADRMFAELLRPSLAKLVGPLDQLQQRLNHPWWGWISHALTAVSSASLTYVVIMWLPKH